MFLLSVILLQGKYTFLPTSLDFINENDQFYLLNSQDVYRLFVFMLPSVNLMKCRFIQITNRKQMGWFGV